MAIPFFKKKNYPTPRAQKLCRSSRHYECGIILFGAKPGNKHRAGPHVTPERTSLRRVGVRPARRPALEHRRALKCLSRAAILPPNKKNTKKPRLLVPFQTCTL